MPIELITKGSLPEQLKEDSGWESRC